LALRGVRAATRPANPRGNRWNIRQGFFRAALGFALHHNGEKHMMRSKLLGVTALVLSSALASPVFAQDVARDHAQKQMRVNSQATHQRHIANRHTGMARENMAYRNDYDGRNGNRREPGFWPGDVAAGVVGGALATAGAAVDTAGAIATAPFRGDSYAYYNNGYNNGWYDQGYTERNGFVCQPGTWFRGADGLRHLCQ
jgi:hypothetical protein